MKHVFDCDHQNRAFYQNESVANWYAKKEFIFEEETSFLNEFLPHLDGRNVLDIGVGAGRTTRFLLPISNVYIGVDYSDEMITQAKIHFPGARLETRDARDLSAFTDGQFDTVLFSFNGIDCLSHAGRLKVFSEVRRVLKPNGIFAFSSHNRDRPPLAPYMFENLCLSKHPTRFFQNFMRYIKGILNWKSSLQLTAENKEFAMRLDGSNNFYAPIYYISKAAQVAQLRKLGFYLRSMYDRSGNSTTVETMDFTSAWIFYVFQTAA